MADGLEVGNCSVFSVGGTSVLGLFENATIDISNVLVNVKPVTRVYDRDQVEKRMAKCSFTQMANNAAVTNRLDHLAVTVFSIGGASYIGKLESGKLTVTATVVKKPEVASEWVWNQVTGKKLEIDGTFSVPTGAADALQTKLKGVITGLSVTVIITIDGVTYEAPMVINGGTIKGERDGLYTVDLKLSGESPDSGAFPTTPTGTTTLFEKALNSRAAVAVAFTTQTTNGNSYAFNAVIASATLDISDENIIKASYDLESQGAVT